MTVNTPPTEARLRDLRARALAGDPFVQDELDRIARLASLESFASQAQRDASLREYQFTSSVPLVGPLIIALRSAANNLATRWVVRALTAQQNRFNAATALALAESVELNRWLLARIEALEARVAQLERESANR